MSPTVITTRSHTPHLANLAALLAIAFILAAHNVAGTPSNGGGFDASAQNIIARDGAVAVNGQLPRDVNWDRSDHPLSKRRLRRHRAGLHARRSLVRRQDSTDEIADEDEGDANEDTSTSTATVFTDPERTVRATPTSTDSFISSTTTVTSTATSLVFSGSSIFTTKETVTSTLEPTESTDTSSSDWTQTFTTTLTLGVNATSSKGKAEEDSTSKVKKSSSTIEPSLPSLLEPMIPVLTSGSLIKAGSTDHSESKSHTSTRRRKTSSVETSRITVDGVVWTIDNPSSTSSAEPSRITVDGVVWEDMSFLVPAAIVEPIGTGYLTASPTPPVIEDDSEAHLSLAEGLSSSSARLSRASASPVDVAKRTVTATASAPPLLSGSQSAATAVPTTAADDDCEDEDPDEDDCDDEQDVVSTSSNIKLASTTSTKKASSSSSTSANAFPNVVGTSISTPTTASSKTTGTSTKTSTTKTTASTSTSTSTSTATSAFDTFWDNFLQLFKDLASGETTAKAAVPSQSSSVWKTLNTAFGFSKRELLLEGEEWHRRDDEEEGLWFVREE